MKVLHVVALMGRDAGGPARSIQGLVAALCKRGVDAWVWPLDGTEPWLPGVRKVEVIANPRTVAASATGADQRVGSPHGASFARGIRYHACRGDRDGTVEGYANASTLEQSNNRTIRTIEQFDLVHIHGIWSWGLHRVAVLCRKAGVPYIIAPRGMLEPWSLKQKGLKKRIARWLYQDRDLRLAAALHATAESEAEQFRRLGFKNKIIVAPNGVNVPEKKVEKKGGGGQRRTLFVSRMHPKKGVLELVESWARVKKEVERRGGGGQWCVELVYTVNGETEKAYEQKVKDRILALGMTYSEGDNSTVDLDLRPRPDFLFTGPLDDNSKWSAYARADLFVLPTYSENFGIVVAEALWAGVPVITTKGTPWAELECSASSKFKVQSLRLEERCGWWVDLPGAEEGLGRRSRSRGGQGGEWTALDAALREAMSLPVISDQNLKTGDKYHCPPPPLFSTSLHEMGVRGHQLVVERYTWAAVCGKIVCGYETIRTGA